MFWRRRGPASFHGVRFGDDRAAATRALIEVGRRYAPSVKESDHDDGLTGGGTVYLEAGPWTLGFEYDCTDLVTRHMGMWPHAQIGEDASLAFVRARVEAYGPPGRIALLAPQAPSRAEAKLEYPAKGRTVSIGLRSSGPGEWDAREDWDTYAIDRPETIALEAHRARLAGILERAARIDDGDPLLARTVAWVRERDRILAALAAIAPRVGVVDAFDAAGGAEDLVAAFGAARERIDGVFVIARAAAPEAAESVRQAIRKVTGRIGLRSAQLTWTPGYTHAPETNEPLPPPPEDAVDWVEGSIAGDLLSPVLLVSSGPRVEIVPARLVTVPRAVEEWLHVPPAPEPRSHFKYSFLTSTLHPLRLRDPALGISVYLNSGSREEMLQYAHALLARGVGTR